MIETESLHQNSVFIYVSNISFNGDKAILLNSSSLLNLFEIEAEIDIWEQKKTKKLYI